MEGSHFGSRACQPERFRLFRKPCCIGPKCFGRSDADKITISGVEIPPQGNFEMEIRSDEVCKLFPVFFDWYQCHMKEHERFFQEELEPMLGIDVLAKTFPKQKAIMSIVATSRIYS